MSTGYDILRTTNLLTKHYGEHAASGPHQLVSNAGNRK